MRKRMLSAAMAGMMVVSMTACGGSKPAETTAAATEAETSAEESYCSRKPPQRQQMRLASWAVPLP